MALEELTSIEIHSVADIIGFVKVNALRTYHTCTNSMSLYRGQSDYEWHLAPAVYRNDQFQFESIYIKELERIRPLEFTNCDNFDKLVKMQHYGLPTRLLDVTSNPLVALYFACKNRFEKDGAFYYFSTPAFWEDNWAIQIVTDYVMEPINSINDLLLRERHRLPEVFKRDSRAKEMIQHALGVPAHAVLPKNTNQRIQQQSGAFLLFGMSYRKPKPERALNTPFGDTLPFCELDVEQEKNICPVIKKIKIPAQYKQTILEELDLLNINEGFLFPELEYQSKNVVQYVQRRILPPKSTTT